MYQANHHVLFIIFHLSMDRFYIIWNLRFGQVYILDLPLGCVHNKRNQGLMYTHKFLHPHDFEK
jgi:hypothetical protein